MIPVRMTKHVALAACWISGLACSALYLLGSTRVVVSKLGSSGDKLSAFSNLLIALTLTGSLLAFLLYRTARAWEFSVPGEAAVRPPRQFTHGLVIFQILCSLVVITRSVSNIGVPLDWDEHEHAANLAGGFAWQSINPLRGSENHPLASAAAYLSMAAFGANKYAARLPAVLFAIAFLALLNWIALEHLPRTTSVIYFLSLVGNGMVLYMMHSMRGYMPMMFFTLLSLYPVMDFTRHRVVREKWRRALFVFSSGAALFSHTFGGLFLALLLVSLLIWSYGRRNTLTSSQHGYSFTLMGVLVGWLMVFSVMSLYILLHLQETGFALPKDQVPEWLTHLATFRLFTIFGFARIWEIRLFTFLLAILVAWRLYRPSDRPLSFTSLFAMVCFVSMVGLVKILNVPLLEGRMLTPFLALFFFWIGETLERIPHIRVRKALTTVIILLFTLPFALHRDDDDGVPGHFADHEKFAETVKKVIAVQNINLADRCFSFSGDPAGSVYARNFYFVKEKRVESAPDCKVHYHLFYAKGLFGAVYSWNFPPAVTAKVLFNDGKGRLWYQIMDRPLSIDPRLAVR